MSVLCSVPPLFYLLAERLDYRFSTGDEEDSVKLILMLACFPVLQIAQLTALNYDADLRGLDS